MSNQELTRRSRAHGKTGSSHMLGMLLTALFCMAGIGSLQAASERPIEEITITGRDITKLRSLLDETENTVISMFNELNDDPLFEMTCEYTAFTGSKIKRKQCRANYLNEAEAAVAKDMVSTLQGTGRSAPATVASAVQHYAPRLEEKMRELMRENPDFFEAVLEHHRVRQVYNESRNIYLDQ